jgi:heptosyltransferase I
MLLFNISADTYSEIFHFLDSKKINVYFTKGSHPIDKEYIDKIQNKYPEIKILENLSLETLLDIYKNSKLVIAPSTGPLHLAHYSGTRTLGFYPPILHQSAKRWAPYGGAGESFISTPPSMDQIDWKPLLEKALND